MGQRGQTTAEYALLVAFVVIALIGTMKTLESAVRWFCEYAVAVVCLPVP